ncbi:MAG: MOSC domain-containing protein [Acidobacteria bacterium]|nr:MOSC domain-containing protein [Acidobacteriota bacterium]
MSAYVYQLNLSRGGVPKLPVPEAELTATGLVGDKQAKPFIHGGAEKALSLYALELIERLRAEGHPITPGSAGENVTVAGLDWSRLAPGSRLTIGDQVVVEISRYANPCPTIRGSFAGGEFKRISQKLRPGESRLYARVLRAGRVAVGQEIRVVGEAGRVALDAGELANASGADGGDGSRPGRLASALSSLAGRKSSGAV